MKFLTYLRIQIAKPLLQPLESVISRLESELEQHQKELKVANEALTNTTARCAQLQSALDSSRADAITIQRDALDRVERLACQTANHLAISLGKRPVFPGQPIPETLSPAANQIISKDPIGKVHPRAIIEESNRRFNESYYAPAPPDPKTQKSLEEIQQKLMSEEWFIDAAGKLRDAKTNEVVGQLGGPGQSGHPGSANSPGPVQAAFDRISSEMTHQ